MRAQDEYFSKGDEQRIVQGLIDGLVGGGEPPPTGLGIPIDDLLLDLYNAVQFGGDQQAVIDRIWGRVNDDEMSDDELEAFRELGFDF